MKIKYIIYFVLVFCTFNIQAQATKNSFEIGLNTGYILHSLRNNFIESHKIKMPYLSYTRSINKVYIKADFSWAAWETGSLKILNKPESSFIDTKNAKLFHLGIAKNKLFGLKNTLFFFNLAYIDYYDYYTIFTISKTTTGGLPWKESFVSSRDSKNLGIGLEIKQRFEINEKTYAHLKMGYDYIYRKRNKASYELIPASQFEIAGGIGMRF